MKLKSLVLFASSLFLFASSICSAQDTRPSVLFDQTLAAYQSMSSYSSQGTVSEDMTTDMGEMKFATTFTIKLKRPNQYLITWSHENPGMNFPQPGAIWNDGSGPFMYVSYLRAYAKMKGQSALSGDEIALSSATGISGGAVFTIPVLFFPMTDFSRSNPFARLTNPQVEGSDIIDGDDCFRIDGASTISKKETFWLSKKTHLIKQYSHSFEAPAGTQIPQMTDKQLDDILKAQGQEPTDARRQHIRDMMKQSQQLVGHIKGSSTETQTQISSPDFKPADFTFQLPPGTVLKDSLFGEHDSAKQPQ